jgi:hypothetical protein
LSGELRAVALLKARVVDSTIAADFELAETVATVAVVRVAIVALIEGTQVEISVEEIVTAELVFA